jgi:type II secretory pathway pseudopilin PulG
MYLRSQPSRGPTPRCCGFTITEMVIATFLMALLAVLLAVAVATFARPAAEVDGRTRLVLEASLAAEALARDLGGYLVDNSGVPGTLTQYQFSNWIPSSDGTTLVLNYQGTPPAPVSVSVTYQWQQQNYQLVRILGNSVQTVAVHVTGFNASLCNPDGSPNPAGSYMRIEITLTYPDPSSPRQSNPSFSGTYVLIGVQPPPLPTQ